MKVYTSYFGNLKKLKGLTPISISISPPKWFKGKSILELAPTKYQLYATLNGKMSIEEFDKQFNQHLNNLDADKIMEKIKSLSNGKNVVLLCFEKDWNECHRKDVAEWLNKKLNVGVEEYKEFDGQLSLF